MLRLRAHCLGHARAHPPLPPPRHAASSAAALACWSSVGWRAVPAAAATPGTACAWPALAPARAFSSASSGDGTQPAAAATRSGAKGGAGEPSLPSPTPPSQPQKDDSSRQRRIFTALQRPVRAASQAGSFLFRHARARPLYAVLLLSVLGLGVGFGLWRRSRARRERDLRKTQHTAMLAGYSAVQHPPPPKDASRTVPAFVMPEWAEHGPASFRDLAALLNAMPQLVRQLRECTPDAPDRPLKCETRLRKFSFNTAVTPVMTPAQALERLRVLLHDDHVLDALVEHVSPSALVEPLVSLLVHPLVAPPMSKYAASCLAALTRRSELCEQLAAHSTIDALVALAHYTDFTAWNYVYMLQQEPERVRAFQQAWLQQTNEHAARPNPLQLPVWMLPYHSSSALPVEHASHPTESDDYNTTFNCSTSPTFALQDDRRSTEEQGRHVDDMHSSSPESQLIQLLLRLPLVSQEAQREQLGNIVAHLVERGLAAHETGDSLAQIGRDLKEEVLQAAHSKAASLQRSAAVALTPTLQSSLAGDDLALVRDVSAHMIEKRSPPGLIVRGVQRFLARHTYSYAIGAEQRVRKLTAKQQEVYYHAIRALATLATDPHTAARIVQQDGVRMLYQVYAHYPHELRVQIQVARCLANLLEHCPTSLAASEEPPEHYKLDPSNAPQGQGQQRLHQVVEQALAWSNADKTTQSRAAYTAIAHSGFLPLLVHWAQHALNYTDAAVTQPPPTKREAEAKANGVGDTSANSPASSSSSTPVLPQQRERQTVVSAEQAASDEIKLPSPASIAPEQPVVSISTRPSEPSSLHAQIQRLQLLQQAKHKSDEQPTLPIPPPAAKLPAPTDDATESSPSSVPLTVPSMSPVASSSQVAAPSASPAPSHEKHPAAAWDASNHPSTSSSKRSSKPLPTQLPHHPESSASLRNKLQLQSFRALVNLRSVLALNTLAAATHADTRSAPLFDYDAARTTHFPVLQDEVYLFHPFLDTLEPSSAAAPRESKAQKYSNAKREKQKGRARRTASPSAAAFAASSDSPGSSVPAPPLPPPHPDVDIVFIHGLMGNPLRTWRLHSMYDKTIGWIPSSVDERELRKRIQEQRRKGDVFTDAEWSQSALNGSATIRSSPAPGGATDDDANVHLSPLDLHLSNVVSSAPLPPPPEPAAMSKVAINVAARVLPSRVQRAVAADKPPPGKQQQDKSSSNVKKAPRTAKVPEAQPSGSIDPSPAAPPTPSEPTNFPLVAPGHKAETIAPVGSVAASSAQPSKEVQRLQKVESSTLDVKSELEGRDPELEPPHAPIHASQHSLDFETLWPRDWIPDAFPSARVTSLGYSTSLTMKSTGELHSRTLEARAAEMAAKLEAAGVGQDGRRIVWVVHSMGGLIVKQILLNLAMAEERERERERERTSAGGPGMRRQPSSPASSALLRQTAGVVFYSTPHLGTWIPNGMLSHQNMLSRAFFPSYELLDLQNVGKLRELNARFKAHVIEGGMTAHAATGGSARDPLPTLSLGEGIGTPLLHLNRATQRVVSWRFVMPDSSRPGFGQFLYFPTQNHLTICKPKTMLDENYTAVRKFIAQAIRTSTPTHGSRDAMPVDEEEHAR